MPLPQGFGDSDAPGISPAAPRRFVFLLLSGFTMLSLASALEALRLANRAAGRPLYDWALAAEDGPEGAGAVASNGIVLRPDIGLTPLARGEAVIVCGGIDAAGACSRPVLGWLRREARRGAVMAGLCTGSHALARAGLLDGRRATIHWEDQDAFAERFPEVTLIRAAVVMDANRWSTAGGTAAIDLMLRVIAADHGEDLAAEVADQLLHVPQRPETGGARQPGAGRLSGHHPRLGPVVQAMEEHLEDPLSPAELALAAGMSTRQLERLFRRHMNRSPKRYYMELRLQKARKLLMQTDMSVINIALACGFASPSHFAKCYRAHFALTPYRERGGKAGARFPDADVVDGATADGDPLTGAAGSPPAALADRG